MARVHLASWRSAYRGSVPDVILEALTVADFEARWRRDFDAFPDARQWLVDCGNEGALGLAAAGRSRDGGAGERAGEVYAIHLVPERVGGGLGRRLFEEVLAYLGALGCLEVTLWVLEGNERARRFYERAGLAADGARRDRVFVGGDVEVTVVEVRYRRTLAPV